MGQIGGFRMRVVVRIHKRSDYDLLSLHLTKGFSLNELFRATLIAFAKGETFSIKIPSNVEKNISDEISSMRVDFNLKENDPEHKLAIDVLQSIKNKKRNDFLKTLLRGYLSGPVLASYFCNDSYDEQIKDMEHVFNGSSKKMVDITSAKKKKQAPEPKTDFEKAVAEIFQEEEVDGEVKFVSSEDDSIQRPIIENQVDIEPHNSKPEPIIPNDSDIKPATEQKTKPTQSRFNINTNVTASVETIENDTGSEEDDFDILSSLDDMMSEF